MRNVIFSLTVLLLIVSCETDNTPAEPEPDTPAQEEDSLVELELSTELVVSGINIPWGMDWLSNGDLLITERSGTLYRWDGASLTSISGLPEIHANGQGGLLDIIVHPDHDQNGWVYLSYSKRTEGNLSTTAVIRGKIAGNELTDVEELLVGTPATSSGNHYGSRLAFDEEGYLYVSLGDRANRDVFPQTLDNSWGKVHRIHEDGSVPSDNPFVNEGGDVVSTIYTYGHRNPQGLLLDPFTGEIWEHEHGPQGGDELNSLAAGDNYGWPVITYGINYDGTIITEETEREGMEQPEMYWVPSIAPSSMDFVTTTNYGALKGDLLIGAMKFEYLHRCHFEDGEVVKEEKLLEGIGRIRSLKEGPDGSVYLGVDGKGIHRLVVVD